MTRAEQLTRELASAQAQLGSARGALGRTKKELRENARQRQLLESALEAREVAAAEAFERYAKALGRLEEAERAAVEQPQDRVG